MTGHGNKQAGGGRALSLLAISGSMRAASVNTALLEALQDLCPPDMTLTLCPGLDQLPVFSPDREQPAPPQVEAFAARVRAADGLIISSPEYVRALPGGLKNAIDWLVSRDEIIRKPIALAHASHRGEDMLASLRMVLSTVSERFEEDLFLRVPLISQTPRDVRRIMAEPETAAGARAFLVACCEAFRPCAGC